MSSSDMEPPVMQRLYDNVWLLAVLALLFWFLSYVVWGLVDIFTIPPGMIL